jgi:hypothetical protein
LYVGRAHLRGRRFFTVSGLFLLGIRLSDGMVFQFLDTDLRGPIAGALTPEVGNVAGLVYYMRCTASAPSCRRRGRSTSISGHG